MAPTDVDPTIAPSADGCVECLDGPALAEPAHRPIEQSVPGPAGAVPAEWKTLLRH